MTDNSLYEELCKIREQYLCRDCSRRFTDCPMNNGDAVRHGHIVYRERYRKYYRTYTGIDENGETHTISVCEDYGSGKEPYCSECGSKLAESFLNYCPNCGAKMEGDDAYEKIIANSNFAPVVVKEVDE